MKEHWLKLAARFDPLSARERWMVVVALLGGILFVGATFFIEPAMKRAALAERASIEQRKQLADLKAQTLALQSPGPHPDVAARTELDALKGRISDLVTRFAAMEGSLVSPERMSGLLENLIGRNSGLRLLSLRTLPVKPVLDKAAASDKAADQPVVPSPAAGLYKHGVEIRLQGGYQELAAYLERLEKSPQKLLWSSVSLSADKPPVLVLTRTVYTLSLDRTWLIV